MKPMINIVGILLIVFGIIAFGYHSFTYTKQEKVAQIGSLQVTADTEKTIYFSPVIGGVSLVAGIILLVIGRRK